MKKKLHVRLGKIQSERGNAVKELEELEKLISEDGVVVEKLDQKELLELIDKKALSLDRIVSESALHVLAGGRCAGSYGCAVDVPIMEEEDTPFTNKYKTKK